MKSSDSSKYDIITNILDEHGDLKQIAHTIQPDIIICIRDKTHNNIQNTKHTKLHTHSQ